MAAANRRDNQKGGCVSSDQIIIGLQLSFGSGILLYLIRLSFLLGKYVEQVATLRETVSGIKTDLHEMDSLRVLVARLEVTVESFRSDLNQFRERRISALADRRAE